MLSTVLWTSLQRNGQAVILNNPEFDRANYTFRTETLLPLELIRLTTAIPIKRTPSLPPPPLLSTHTHSIHTHSHTCRETSWVKLLPKSMARLLKPFIKPSRITSHTNMWLGRTPTPTHKTDRIWTNTGSMYFWKHHKLWCCLWNYPGIRSIQISFWFIWHNVVQHC